MHREYHPQTILIPTLSSVTDLSTLQKTTLKKLTWPIWLLCPLIASIVSGYLHLMLVRSLLINICAWVLKIKTIKLDEFQCHSESNAVDGLTRLARGETVTCTLADFRASKGYIRKLIGHIPLEPLLRQVAMDLVMARLQCSDCVNCTFNSLNWSCSSKC